MRKTVYAGLHFIPLWLRIDKKILSAIQNIISQTLLCPYYIMPYFLHPLAPLEQRKPSIKTVSPFKAKICARRKEKGMFCNMDLNFLQYIKWDVEQMYSFRKVAQKKKRIKSKRSSEEFIH